MRDVQNIAMCSFGGIGINVLGSRVGLCSTSGRSGGLASFSFVDAGAFAAARPIASVQVWSLRGISLTSPVAGSTQNFL